MSQRTLVVLAAGGTGGHLFPAQALAEALAARDVRVALVTDTRVSELVSVFPAESVHEVPSATPSRKSLPVMAKAALTLGRGIWTARGLLRRLRPAAVVGFGGYPSVPPLLAASMMGAPTIIHEQNAVLGRANRFLAGRVSAIATGFVDVGGLTADLRGKTRHVGNPVRPPVLVAAREPYPALGPDTDVRLLVFGGSQGARVMSEVVPDGLGLLPGDLRSRLRVTQQARPEDLERVRRIYRDLGIAADVAPFFGDLPARIAASHLVVARSGASTVAELAVVGRPSVLVPLPGSLDQDQAANARTLEVIGAALLIPQREFTAIRLAADLAAFVGDPAGLTRAAEAAKSAGIPDAAERLADLVVELARLTA